MEKKSFMQILLCFCTRAYAEQKKIQTTSCPPWSSGPYLVLSLCLILTHTKIIHFPLWVRSFWSPNVLTKMYPLESFYVWDVFPLSTHFISFALGSFRNYILHVHLVGLYIFVHCSIRNMDFYSLLQMRYTGSPINYKLFGSRTSFWTFPWFWFCLSFAFFYFIFLK